MANVNHRSSLNFNFRFDGQQYVLALLGNLSKYKETYLPAVMLKAGPIVDDVAKNYFRNLYSKKKNKNPDSMFLASSFVTWSWTSGKQSIDIKLENQDERLQWYLFGTRKHDIFAKNVNFLKFYYEAEHRFVYVTHVNHPGARKHLGAIGEIRRRSFKRLETLIRKQRILHNVGRGR